MTEFDRRWSVTLVLIAGLLGSGCALLEVKQQREEIQALAHVRGSVATEIPSDSPLVVVLLGVNTAEPGGPTQAQRRIADHFVLERPGSFVFGVAPGRYALAAFEDRNKDLKYTPGEPALALQSSFTVEAGQNIETLKLVIPPDQFLDREFDILAIEGRSPLDQAHFSLGRFSVTGEVTNLDEIRFGSQSGRMGMWRFADFLFEMRPGVYFLEAFDPDKVPILFVHGISGYPQEFRTLIERLDRSHFQPWFYFYPSGMHLEGLASQLSQSIAELQVRHGFQEMGVVAHSMGGLVSRAFIQNHHERTRRQDIKTFIAISSPWGGSMGASGVETAPQDVIVYSWLDMDPESDFLKGLFHQSPDYRRPHPLPAHTAFHMIFSYGLSDPQACGDGVVSVQSEARIEAQQAARSILALESSHQAILRSDETVRRVNSILAKAFGDSGS
jgi:pimeloyl-ACP methyl ester carboxylesterase